MNEGSSGKDTTQPPQAETEAPDGHKDFLSADPGSDLAMLYCPVCDSRLQGYRCKLVCSSCGYFMSCADYY